jgi:hypothetical protein
MPNGGPVTWYDEFWDATVWWSGTEGCETLVDVEGFHGSWGEGIGDALDWVRTNVGGIPMITGGHEQSCHTSGSRHYCGKAFDLATDEIGGDPDQFFAWTPQQKDAFASWAESNGMCVLVELHHIHVSTEPCYSNGPPGNGGM